ncbi:uncharacterized protein B0P05DRAFT_560736 [Gilbertella persicaria]|uniref:uncharacterized protein n=1 Tax=Gilbertella persicaria TaxID=101096 RepID=UPI002220C1B6|nr:uncharacterized protein B0P05DRAFT_566176 [Gilbertella persicaria]XP_051429468.1 uncharacterized protein B0P05DRAFT_564928 [Gilbertella persicaria]XP_051430342.1 uncharacterized protein B0P05DRAFT_560736 [Gilbertella persicaria]KAI8047412.1 hypothetical protein B0P05DRAFT_566176 [Gilbertella persicaria]KAI8048066.1 hypothetical protein B0P05DRAFT_564928 [Gilbertella persicaria]KAI8054920.1 hypothetical protein B0P05DRAFT_560736 [Gilbertella persicaria]
MDPETKNKLILLHAALMVFVWMLAVPKKGQNMGPKVHMLIMTTAGFVPFTISAFIAFGISGQLKLKPHSGIGTALSIGVWSQVMLGTVNHLLFRYRRKHHCLPPKRPWNNHVHIWLGRLLLFMALINIPLGMRIKKAAMPLYILYGIWLLVLAIAFLWLAFLSEKKQDTVEPDKEVEKMAINETKA